MKTAILNNPQRAAECGRITLSPNGKVYLMLAIDAGRSAVHSCRGASASEPPGRLTRRSFSDSFHSVTARTAGWLRRAAVVSLLGLPLLFGLATQAVAQTVPMLKVQGDFSVIEADSGLYQGYSDMLKNFWGY